MKNRIPDASAWADAIDIATGTLKKRHPTMPAEQAEDLAREAAARSADRWQGRNGAAFSTYVTRAALRAATKLIARTHRAPFPSKPRRARTMARPGDRGALGAVLEDCIRTLTQWN